MPVAMQGVVGPLSTTGALAGPQTIRLGAGGDQIVSSLHGKYYEPTARGTVFNACNTAAQVLTTGLATTYTGLMIANPAGSGVNLELLTMGYSLSSVNTAQSIIGVAVGTTTAALMSAWTITALTARSSLLGSGISPKALTLSAAATLSPAPFYAEAVATVMFGTSVAVQVASGTVELAGRFVITPNSYAFVVGNVAQTGFWSFSWMENPY